jgi:hypothetical protein
MPFDVLNPRNIREFSLQGWLKRHIRDFKEKFLQKKTTLPSDLKVIKSKKA